MVVVPRRLLLECGITFRQHWAICDLEITSRSPDSCQFSSPWGFSHGSMIFFLVFCPCHPSFNTGGVAHCSRSASVGSGVSTGLFGRTHPPVEAIRTPRGPALPFQIDRRSELLSLASRLFHPLHPSNLATSRSKRLLQTDRHCNVVDKSASFFCV